MAAGYSDKSLLPHSPDFRTTRWSVVLLAGSHHSADSTAALETLCRTYWPPVYAFIRHQGHDMHQAQDLCQGFFARFLEKNYIANANRERGRFRSLLMSSVENFLHNEHERAAALKRGGGVTLVCLDADAAEQSYQQAAVAEETPASAFEKRWAAVLLEKTLARLEAEFANAEKRDLFNQLQPHLWGDDDAVPYPELSARLNLSTAALKMAALRLRRRFRELLHEEIAHTVAGSEEIEDEIRHLMNVFAS